MNDIISFVSGGTNMNNEEFLKAIKAINDNTRLQILKIVSKSKNICACHILDELSITQGTLSHHMKVLSEAKLIKAEKDGKWSRYSLIRENICAMAHFLQDICVSESLEDCSCKNK